MSKKDEAALTSKFVLQVPLKNSKRIHFGFQEQNVPRFEFSMLLDCRDQESVTFGVQHYHQDI